MLKMHITKAATLAAKAQAHALGDHAAADRADAEALAPWAATIVEADGGWIAFEDSTEATTWDNQS